MPFTIDSVVPWGRTMAEYRGMFNLVESDLRGRILGCGEWAGQLQRRNVGTGTRGRLG